jgi:hypothetical protein
MTEDFGHRQLATELFAICVAALLIVGALFLIGPIALLIALVWTVAGAALGFLIGPCFEYDEEE